MKKNTSMECGDITIDLLGSRATLKGKALDLTSAEYRLLCLLVRNANRVVTRDIILNELWMIQEILWMITLCPSMYGGFVKKWKPILPIQNTL